ncbi:ROK family protein [Streptomyces sp. PTM05]|uniref:ROK family protein n=1 Tax=Streptantibioticus parmotrematis TaxID=2873249 RepID=A0ABS7QJW7_9ACTN|nr:ROK family protein [Streptantibioticus parmotrematis]MBY8883475.1 ROK family protein [Streptantibioticus parmotrematis]
MTRGPEDAEHPEYTEGSDGLDDVVVACDIGGTAIKAGLVDTRGFVRHDHGVPTPFVAGDGAATADAVLAEVVRTTARLREAAAERGGRVVALGVIVPGLVDAEAGLARYSENLGWRDVPFVRRLTKATGLPVGFDHDVRAAGAAEQRLGAARGRRDVAFVPIGTGISASLVLDGRPYAGGGWAGEIGHLDAGSGLPCPCGGTGCLETVASASAIRRRYEERTGRAVSGAVDVAARLERGDPDARVVWDAAIDALAVSLTGLAAVVAPELVLIGGGLSGAGDALLAPLRRALDARLTLQRRPELRLAGLGDRAGLLGAALLAWERVGVRVAEPGPPASRPAVHRSHAADPAT